MICPICKKQQYELKHSVKCGCGFRIKHKKDVHPKKQPEATLKASSM